MRIFIAGRRKTDEPFDIVIPAIGNNGGWEGDRARVKEFEEAGATWIMDAAFPKAVPLEVVAEVSAFTRG